MRTMIRILAVLLPLTIPVGQVHAAADAPAAGLYVLLYAPGPAWKQGVPIRDQGLGPHLAYMQHLRDDHRLFAAGPLVDSNGGLVIIRAAGADIARDVMDHDPAIIAHIFTGRIESWRAAVDSGKTIADFLTQP
jgi:uncharacterized protein YciI